MPHIEHKSGLPLAMTQRQVTGEYFFHMRLRTANLATRDPKLQEKLIDTCEEFSSVALPEN